MEQKPSALDRVNVRRMINAVKKGLSENTQAFLFFSEKDDDKMRASLKDTVARYLEDLKQQHGTFKGFTVGPFRETYHGWRELYPSTGKRVLAWFGARVLRMRDCADQRWFHTVFPFSIEYVPSFRSSALRQAEDGSWIVHVEYDEYADASTCVNVKYRARLKVPYTTQDLDIMIAPIAPISTINVVVAVNNDGTADLCEGGQ